MQREVNRMKRVKAACIQQTLVFAQKSDCGMSIEQQRRLNRDEVERYKSLMDRSHTRYQVVGEDDQPDGSVLIRVRKQYNDRVDVNEYFD